ncbi:MAG: T9SS type A sorting domain-containing protein [Bacteroidetes bacterium]|nr:T9SS type A sorting domain-containing protein [Bacteroidota bacterium]
MQNYFYRLFIILAIAANFLLNSTGNATAQSRIYGVSGHNLVFFDYRSGAYDTVLSSWLIPGTNMSFGCTIDPYNGKYFFDANPLHDYGIVNYIDLNTLETGSTSPFEYKNWIEYNCLANSLIFGSPGGDFYSYHLNDSVLNYLSTLPASTGIIYGETRVYNPVTNQYFFQRYTNDTIYFDLIDGFTGEMIQSQPCPYYGMIESVVVDYQTGKYYGVYRDTVVILDPVANDITRLVKLPIPMNHLDNQMAVYDQDSSKYILPTYVNSTDKAYYMVVDVKKARIDTVMEQPNYAMNWQRMYSKPGVRLTKIGDSLVCPAGKSYRWLLGNDTIPGANSSSYKPVTGGVYKVLVNYPAYSGMSNTIDMTGISGIRHACTIRVFPNPARDVISCEISCEGKKNDGSYRVEIINTTGETVFSETRDHSLINGKIPLTEIPAGFYVIRITTPEAVFSKGFVHY